MLKLSFASFGSILVLLGACGGKTDGPDAGQDSGTGDASPPIGDSAPPLADGGSCNALTLPGKPVVVKQIAVDAPPFAGAASSVTPDGRYDLVAMTIYTGTNGASGSSNTVDARAQFTTAKNGFVLDAISSTNGATPLVESATAIPDGFGALDFTPFCPTADPTITIYYSINGNLTMRVLSTPTQTIDEQFVAVP